VDINTVTMDQAEAAKAFREYRAAFMAQRNVIDGELMRGYKALAEGKTLISLTEAIQRGGADEIGRPRLAVARADEANIEMRVDTDGSIAYDPWLVGVRSNDRIFHFPAGTVPARAWQSNDPANGTWTAALPFIPPRFRPPYKIENYHLLWEAEWRRKAGAQRKDPVLLRRLGGDLFAVVAAWDLSEIEKLVLAR